MNGKVDLWLLISRVLGIELAMAAKVKELKQKITSPRRKISLT